jgi:hypothetical protein
MRDPERIDRIINKLWLAWQEHPDWRFHQLLANVRADNPVDGRVLDLFYWEDDHFEARLDAAQRRWDDLPDRDDAPPRA